MANPVPRRLVSEMLMRWRLSRLRLIVVEGPFDQRVLRYLQRCQQFGCPLPDVDVLPVDTIDVPAALTAEHGQNGTGAKQRVITFGREIEKHGAHEGFRCIVDTDLDALFAIDWTSESVLYTDHASMEAYLWTSHVLRGLTLQFQAEAAVPTDEQLQLLYDSLNDCLVGLAAVRAAAMAHPEFRLDIHKSQTSLSFRGGRIAIELRQFVDQCRPVKGALELAQQAVEIQRARIGAASALQVLNGHDLVWLLCFALKAITAGSRRLVEEEQVENALLAFGLQMVPVIQQPLFQRIRAWAGAH